MEDGLSVARGLSEIPVEEPLQCIAYTDGMFYVATQLSIYSFHEQWPAQLLATLPLGKDTNEIASLEAAPGHLYVALAYGADIYQIDALKGQFDIYTAVDGPIHDMTLRVGAH